MRATVLLALALLLAGCVQQDAPEEMPVDEVLPAAAGLGGIAAPANETGALIVRARMPDLSPLPGTTITLGNETRVTDAQATARFTDLAPGVYNVSARKEAHRTAQLEVEIAAGATVEVEAVLPALVETDQHAHEGGVYAHRDLYRFDGHFDCSATYVIITGDCLLLLDNVTATAGAPATPGDATEERYLIDFPLDATWSALVVEMTWTANASTPATGQDMTLALEPAEAPADGHAAKYARVGGAGPLRVELAPGVQHETATAEDMPNPDGGEVIRARAYVAGAAHKPAGTDFLGVGATTDQAFTIFVSIFYGEAPPQSYSALGGA